ncbi:MULTISPECIES: phasin family protein [unclassified Caballeronia]|uniref:phasin family protein n=1 Tax=unclassified Caballeronia TaxID=2646786 RepID=UPI0028627B1F|nr:MULTISPECIES: phasin family protein [unclassified Caballeronia]MDR5739318.1 phasin family protein [Caballeronia sp. LZ016]MDR5807807.1 phasin family protein [Caballeronia sp. LZ019]
MESSTSSLAPENLLASQKAGLDVTFGLASRAVEGFEKLIDLNVRTLRTALADHQDYVTKTFSVRDPKEFFALQNAQFQANAQRTQAYWQQVAELSTGVRGVYLQAAQDQIEKSQRNVQAFVDSIATGAPGSEAVVSAWKQAIDAATQSANSAYEAARTAARQVVEAARGDAASAAQAADAAAPPAVRVVSTKAAGAKK